MRRKAGRCLMLSVFLSLSESRFLILPHPHHPTRGGGLSDSLRHSRSLVSSTDVYTYHFSRFHSSLLLALSRDAVASWWGSECDRGCSARGPTRGLDGSGSATPRGSSLASLGNPRCAILFSTDFGSSSLPRASWHGATLFTRFLFRLVASSLRASTPLPRNAVVPLPVHVELTPRDHLNPPPPP